jgi:hypothetical protein
MKISIYKLRYLIIINFILITSIVIAAKIFGYDLTKLLLVSDDGYFKLSKSLFEGESIMPNILGPGIPIIYYVIHFFPDTFHPFIRLFISFLFSTGIIIIVHYSLIEYLNKKEIFLGSLLFIFNPVYVQWTIKSCPEIFIGFFLALFIFFLLKTLKTNNLVYFVILCLIFFLSFFIKPVLLLVPFPLLIYSVYLKYKQFITFSLILLIVGVSGFFTYNLNTPKVNSQERAEGKYQYGEYANITHTLWINYVIKTKQFYKNSIKPYKVYDDLEQYFPQEQVWLYEGFNGEWEFEYAAERYVIQYYKKNPQGNVIGLNIRFILDYPGLFIQKLIFSPLFFLGMSAHGTFVKLLCNLFFITLGILSLRKCINNINKKELVSMVGVVVGYSILYLMLYSFDRYALPVLPWLIVWSGYYIARVYDKFLTLQKVHFKQL